METGWSMNTARSDGLVPMLALMPEESLKDCRDNVFRSRGTVDDKQKQETHPKLPPKRSMPR